MDNVRDIVNGSQLPRFVNKTVSIIGKVKTIEPNGMGFHITATDDVAVKVDLSEPIKSPVSGWVEVRGTCTGKTVNAVHFVIFSNEQFDCKAHNELCTFLYTVPDIWKTSEINDI